MSLAEKLYLVMVMTMFVSFGILLATLSWLDAREDKAAPSHDRKAQKAAQRSHNNPQAVGQSAAVSH